MNSESKKETSPFKAFKTDQWQKKEKVGGPYMINASKLHFHFSLQMEKFFYLLTRRQGLYLQTVTESKSTPN